MCCWVPATQEHGGRQRGAERRDQDGGLDVLADGRAGEGRLADEQGDREADSGQGRQGEDVGSTL